MATFTYFMVYAFLLTTLRSFYVVFLNLSLGEPGARSFSKSFQVSHEVGVDDECFILSL